MNNNEKRSIAKQYRQSKNYIDAEPLYNELWKDKDEDWDKWLGWEFANTLKGLSKIGDSISISKEVYQKYPEFKYNNDQLCWLLYEKHIKTVSNESTLCDIKSMLKTAEFIVNTVIQDGKKTAFESTVFKVIDVLKELNNVKGKEILKWVDKLDYNLLTDEVIIFNLQDGKNKEGASRKEAFFSIKTKVLEKIGYFDECIECCKIAIEAVPKFHYDNDIWFDVRRNYCIGMTSSGEVFESAIMNLVKLAEKKKHWSIYNKIFDCYIKNENYKEAIVYGAKALLSKDPIKMKVTLLYDFALALEKIGEADLAKEHFALTAQVRKKNEWTIQSSLAEKLEEYKVEDIEVINTGKLSRHWVDLAITDENFYKGKILSILPHGNSGFISVDGGSSYFFKKASVISGQNLMSIGKRVKFRIVESFDPKKQKESKEAVEIIVDYG